MSVNFGSHRLVDSAHYGMRDWLAQRLTAVVMALFVVLVLARLLFGQGTIGYTLWAGIFAPQWMKALTFVVFLSLLFHAWVGIRNVLMDYVKPYAVRLALHALALVWLTTCMGWAVQVLWRL